MFWLINEALHSLYYETTLFGILPSLAVTGAMWLNEAPIDAKTPICQLVTSGTTWLFLVLKKNNFFTAFRHISQHSHTFIKNLKSVS